MKLNSVRSLRVLLVHGSWSEGGCWAQVIRDLQARQVDVRAVQLPLTGLEDDVAALHRAINLDTTPTLLVGHSYGGAVISGVDIDPDRVRGLVFIAGSAPDVAEPLGSLMNLQPAIVTPSVTLDEGQFVWSSSAENFADALAQDLPAAEVRVLHALQKPLHQSLFSAMVHTANWRKLPSWYLIADEDRLFSPTAQLFLAARMGAIVRRSASSHMIPLAQPADVVGIILEAIAASGASG
jgi:pimeloyl-ACP methyl ester carboxylesterase